MARRRDYAAEYARRIARGRALGIPKAEARGRHPSERTLGIPTIQDFRARLADAGEQDIVVKEGDRVMVKTQDPDGATRITVMNRRQYDVIRPKGKPPKGTRRPNVFEYRKRKRRAA
jgi:hypothetical protein